MAIKLLVLDLDGTISLTEKYDGINQQRNPSVLLQTIRPGESGKSLLASEFLPKFLSDSLKCGIEVAVITRAPKPYASTLLNILGIDYLECRPAAGHPISRAEKLKSLLIGHKINSSEMLYIGDEIGDMEAAREVNCKFVFPDWTTGSPNITSEHRKSADTSIYIKLTEDISRALTGENVSTNPYSENKTKSREIHRDKVQELVLRPRIAPSMAPSFSSTFCEQGDDYFFHKDFNSEEIFRPILNAKFCTRYDYENDPKIKLELMKIMRLRFPRYRFEFSRYLDPPKTRFSAHVNYRSPLGSALWEPSKDWRRGKSGPDVHQHLMEFVALVMASHLADEPVKPILIPVPSSEFSISQPAENSLRLAYRISELSGCPILPLLRKDENKKILATTSVLDSKQTYLLIDDQITLGTTMLNCKDFLAMRFGIIADYYAWSHSYADLQPAAIPTKTRFDMQCQTCGFVNEIDSTSCEKCRVVDDRHMEAKEEIVPKRYLIVIAEYESLTGIHLSDTEKIQFSKNPLVGQLSVNDSKRRIDSGIAARVTIDNGKYKLNLVDWVNAMYDIQDPRARTYGRRWLRN